MGIPHRANGTNSGGNVDTVDKQDRIRYELSEKGQAALKFVFADIECLYFFALDAPLPVSFVDASLISGHSNLKEGKDKLSFAFRTNINKLFAFIVCCGQV